MSTSPFTRRRISVCRHPARHFAARLFSGKCECVREFRPTTTKTSPMTPGIVVALPPSPPPPLALLDNSIPDNTLCLTNYHVNMFVYYDCPARHCLARYFSRCSLSRHLTNEHQASTFFCSTHKLLLHDVTEFNSHFHNMHR